MNLWYPPILVYHGVHPEHRSDTPSLLPQEFDRQMALIDERWRPIGFSQWIARWEKGLLPRRSLVVTFDDGTEDTFTQAFPILARYRIPATVFLIAGHIDKPGSLSSEQIRTMAREGISFGSHTVHHAYLPSLPPAQIHEELAESKRRIEGLGLPVEFLSYPAGGFTPAIAKVAQEAGYRAACTTNRGFQRQPVDRWALRRISMHPSASSAFGIQLRCSGYYGLNRRLRPPA